MKNLILRVLAGITLMFFSFLGHNAVANAVTTTTEAVSNLFFIQDKASKLNYRGDFLFRGFVKKDVTLNITELANLKYGKLYELKLDAIEGVPDKRLSLGYFYVQKDKIYKVDPTEENFSKLQTSEDLPADSVIVCYEGEIKDTLGEDQKGLHFRVGIDGNKREYRSYNNMVATGYYESFTWGKGKGLIFYESGFGAERDSIKLQLINNEESS